MNANEILGAAIAVGVPLLTGMLALIKPILSLNTSITQLNAAVKNLADKFDVFENNNHTAHQRLWQKNDEQDNTLNEHDKRLTILETNK